MRACLAMLAVLTLCGGCNPTGSVTHTRFFSTHDAQSYFESVARSKGYEIGGSSAGSSMEEATGERSFEIAIKGDDSVRGSLMRDYKASVEVELTKSGVIIDGRGEWGEDSGFGFNYHQPGATGLIRTNAVVDSEGYIQIDVFMYEHR